jgi:hypothetical protein
MAFSNQFRRLGSLQYDLQAYFTPWNTGDHVWGRQCKFTVYEEQQSTMILAYALAIKRNSV